jgi:hypothetical protein
MWSNRDWAARHIKKLQTTPEEAWEIYQYCENFLVAIDQLRFPPFRRYWTIGMTSEGKKLIVIWEEHRDTKNLISAYEPNEEKVRLYERKTKKGAR